MCLCPAYSLLHYFSPGRLRGAMGLHQNTQAFFSFPVCLTSAEVWNSFLLCSHFTSMSTLDYGSNLGKVILKNTVFFVPSHTWTGRGAAQFCVVPHNGMAAVWTGWVCSCYFWLHLLNISASVLFGLKITHYVQSISSLTCQWGDLNNCLGCKSQMGFKTGGKSLDKWWCVCLCGNRTSCVTVLCFWEGCRNNEWFALNALNARSDG